MKQKLFQFIAILMMAFLPAFSMFGQNDVAKTSSVSSNNNWYISVGGGPNLLMANQDSKGELSDRIMFGGEISGGKWINSLFGIRSQFYLGQYCGFNYYDPQGGTFTHGNGKSYYPKGWPDKVDFVKNRSGFYQEFTSAALFFDFTVNITQLFRMHDTTPKHFDVIGYLGAGYLHNWESETNPNTDCIGGRFGGRLNYNLVKGGPWAIYLEGNGVFLPEKFDGYIGDKGYDAASNLLIGVQYTFKR